MPRLPAVRCQFKIRLVASCYIKEAEQVALFQLPADSSCALPSTCQSRTADKTSVLRRYVEIGAGVEDGICICEDTQQEDATFFTLPDDVKASFRQDIHERSYKVRSDAVCASSSQNGQHIVIC